jgi:hypothetical protein
MREESLQRQIVQYLRACGFPAWLTHDSRHHPVEQGIADINAVLPGGVFFACEVKAPGYEKAHADTRGKQEERSGHMPSEQSDGRDIDVGNGGCTCEACGWQWKLLYAHVIHGCAERPRCGHLIYKGRAG